MRAKVMIAAGLLGGAALLAGCAGGASAGNAPGGTDGASIVSANCGRCHPLERVAAAHHTRDEWTSTISRMREHGLQLSDAQAQAVIDYLTKRDGGS